MGWHEFNINSVQVPYSQRAEVLVFAGYKCTLDRFFYKYILSNGYKKYPKTRWICDYDEGCLLRVYENTILMKIIIHPRLRSDFYKNTVYMQAFTQACETFSKIVYITVI